MKILDSLGNGFNRFISLFKAREEDPSPYGTLISEWGYSTSGRDVVIPATNSALLKQYKQSLWVYKCVSTKGRAMGNVPYLLKERIAGAEDNVVGESPFLELIENPYPELDITWPILQEITTAHLELAGNAYWEKVRAADGTIIGLVPLLPDKMERNISRDGEIRYIYRPFGRDMEFDPADIVPFRYPDPTVEGQGMGAMLPGFLAAATDWESAKWNEVFFRRGAVPDVVMKTQKAVPPKERERLRKEWVARHQGVAKGRGVAMLPYGLDVTLLGETHREMQFKDLRLMTREEIHAAFHVPPVMSGLMDQASYATASVQIKVFRDFVLKPLARYIFSVVTQKVLSEFDESKKLYLDTDEARMETPEERAERRKSARDDFAAGLITRAEARAELGYTDDAAELDAQEEQEAALGAVEVIPAQDTGVVEGQSEPGQAPPTPTAGAAGVAQKSRFRHKPNLKLAK